MSLPAQRFYGPKGRLATKLASSLGTIVSEQAKADNTADSDAGTERAEPQTFKTESHQGCAKFAETSVRTSR